EDRTGRIVVDATTGGPQLLAITERFHPGWRITDEPLNLDSHQTPNVVTPPLRVNGDFLGCVVGPGQHRVTFRFWPPSFEYGLWMTAAGLALVLCALPFAI